MRHGLNLCRLPDRLVRSETALRVNQVRRKDSVDKCRLSQSSLAYTPTSVPTLNYQFKTSRNHNSSQVIVNVQ